MPASFEPFKIYWRTYGGLRELIKSPYLYASIIISAICYPMWMDRGMLAEGRPSSDVLLTVVPALMAFTLAGMAIVLALSGRRFADAIREKGRPDSLFMSVVALFFHFILVQTTALILAFISKSYSASDILAGAAFFFAIYGVASAVAIAAMLLNVSRIYNLTGGGDD